jgi:hypothetical protein
VRGDIAIEAKETTDLLGTFTSGLEFDNLTIWGFAKGISIEGSGAALQWDITGVRVNHCVIAECVYAIYIDSQNASFLKIVDTRIGSAKDTFGIYLLRVGIIVIDSVVGAGPVLPPAPPPPNLALMADSFIYITSVRGTVTIINCECESYRRSIQVIGPSGDGNVSWPILLLNCALGPKVLLNSQCDLVSVGSRFLPGTVECGPLGIESMIFSFGDMIIGLDKVQNPNYDFTLNASSRVARANRYRVDFQRPTRIGGHGGQPAPILPTTALAVAAPGPSGNQLALCNPAGGVLFNLRAEENSLVFQNPAGANLMRLDGEGNLYLQAKVFEDAAP